MADGSLPGMFFMQPKKTAASKIGPLPVLQAQSGMMSGLRLLVRMPTRSRPAQALRVLQAYRDKAGIPILMEVVIDEDDESMNAPGVLQRLNSLGCVITVGKSKSKIEAVNAGRVKDWDVLLLASDDMVPISEGYAKRVLEAMEMYFPYLDGVIYFNDDYAGQKLCTLPIMGRRLYEQFGYVYEPSYKSFWCDNEQTDLLLAMGRLVYIDEKLIQHRHPAGNTKTPTDELYEKNNGPWSEDSANYETRKVTKRQYSQFSFDSPPIWLSICIATVPSRKRQLDVLVDHLYEQMKKYPREVEILFDFRENETTGAKRHSLLQRAVGHFVASLDDDDWVSHDYLERTLSAIKANPNVDCLDLQGVMTVDGDGSSIFIHSLDYKVWRKGPTGIYERMPNHLNAVRREIALRVGFVSKTHGEDHDFSNRLLPHLKTQASTGNSPLYYYWKMTGQ